MHSRAPRGPLPAVCFAIFGTSLQSEWRRWCRSSSAPTAASLHKIARSHLGSSALARDAVRDVFTAVWFRRQTIEVRGPVRVYLAVAVRNRARTQLRETLRRRERDSR